MARELDLRRLVNQEGNERIGSQIALICTSDARAVGLLAASISLAGVAAAAGLAIQTISGLANNVQLLGFSWGVAIFAAAASIAAFWAIWPTQIELPGWSPAAFEDDWSKTEETILSDLLNVQQVKITTNTWVLHHTWLRTQLAMCLLATAPVGGAIGSLWLMSEMPRLLAAVLTAIAISLVLGYLIQAVPGLQTGRWSSKSS